PADVGGFSHGMTVGTNALLEGTGARAALVATEGFGDVLELRRQTRAHLYRLDAHHPPPLVPAERVVEARERCTPDGVEAPLDTAELADVVARVAALRPEAVAVGLLFSFRHPDHEQRIAEALRAALPGVHVSASSDVLPEIREYERISTTVVDAYLTPVLARYLERLAARTREADLPAPTIMLSSGGVLPLADAARHAAWTVMSGPAAGALGAAYLADVSGEPEALAFDMGGTSCDVAHVADGRAAWTAENTIAGHPVHLPMLDVATVSAGGGSIAWRDAGGALRVGPRSAGARPGPASYGRGGTRPTVTDANVVLGRLSPDEPLGDAVRLDVAAARRAVGALAADLGLGLEECAEGIVAVAVQEMVRALRLVSVERGIDPRGMALVALGGAGPLHACAVADELGMTRVLAPRAAGVLAALGLVVAGERRDLVQSVLRPVEDASDLPALLAPLALRAERELPGAAHAAAADCRYLGQTHALTVPWDPERPAAELAEAFHRAHEQRYGDCDRGRAVQAVSLRLTAERPGTRPDLEAGEPGARVTGPRAIPMEGATCWVAPGWSARTDPRGTILLERA
ncbi:MAG: hydantoinase/oxoprolinase family protein, partial [Actinomycetota bacterium]